MNISSCVVYTYQPVFDHSSKTNSFTCIGEPLTFNVKRSYKKGLSALMGGEISKDQIMTSESEVYQTIRKVFEENSKRTFIEDCTPATNYQTFVSITIYDDYKASYGHQGWCEAFFLTLGIIPCYGDLEVFETEYELFIGKHLQASYSYRFSMKGAQWIGLLPFFWLSFFTNSYEDALATTAVLFFTDAKKDGHF